MLIKQTLVKYDLFFNVFYGSGFSSFEPIIISFFTLAICMMMNDDSDDGEDEDDNDEDDFNASSVK